MGRPKSKNTKRDASKIEAIKVKRREYAKRRRLSQKLLQSDSLSTSGMTSFVQILTQSKKLTNAEKCKLYRQRKKLEKFAQKEPDIEAKFSHREANFEAQRDIVRDVTPIATERNMGPSMSLEVQLDIANYNSSYSGMSAVTAVVGESELVENPRSKHECRTCLQVSDKDALFPLFQTWSPSSEGMESTLGQDLAKIANVQLSETDRHSKFICHSCVQQLKAACQFISKKNDKILNQRCHTEHISCEEVWPKPIQIDKTIALSMHSTKLACENILDVNMKQEVLLEDKYECNLEDQYREDDINNQVEIKIEPEEIVHPELVSTTVNSIENILDVNIKQEEVSKDEYECKLEDQYREDDFNNQVEIKVEPEEIIHPEPVTTTVNGNCTTLKFNYENVEMENGDAHCDDELMATKVKDEPLSYTEESEVAHQAGGGRRKKMVIL